MSANVVAIDGPAASGKSSAAKILAKELSAIYVNTGAMYRAVAWKLLKEGLDPASPDPEKLEKLLDGTVMRFVKTSSDERELEVDGVIPGEALRTPEVSAGASKVAAIPSVRKALVDQQRNMLSSGDMLVMEGRDIGTAVFPDAVHKFFLTASPLVRAKRRLLQDTGKCDPAEVEKTASEIAERDKRDSTRKVSPLVQAPDAVFLDNSDMTMEETISFMKERILR